METQIVKIDPKEFGLETKKANELTVGLKTVLAERELLIKEFEVVSKLELTVGNLAKFKELRLKIVKNRTQGVWKWHKTNKEYFLTGGKFVDAIKNKESFVNETMEDKLLDAEKHFENLEKERIANLQTKRVALLSEFVDDASERDLSSMEQDVWDAYLSSKKQQHIDLVAAELKAEKERVAKEKAEKEEQERIRKENEKLKLEAEQREKLAKIEEDKRVKEEQDRKAKEEAAQKKREEEAEKIRLENETKLNAEREENERIQREEKAKRDKLESELKAKEEAELKAKKEQADKLKAEAMKGDSDKVKDFIYDLQALKTKYVFEAEENIEMQNTVAGLLDKIVSFINK